MFIGSWFKAIMTIPKKLGVFIKKIANLAGMIARQFLFCLEILEEKFLLAQEVYGCVAGSVEMKL